MKQLKYRLIKEYPFCTSRVGEIVSILTYDSITEYDKHPEYWTRLYDVTDGIVSYEDTVYYLKGNEIASCRYKNAYLTLKLYKDKANVEALIYKDIQYYISKVDFKLYDMGMDDVMLTRFIDAFPKQYWQMVLQKIADHLNEGWIADDSNSYQTKFRIAKKLIGYTVKGIVHSFNSTSVINNVYFKSKYLTNKAISIMGDKLNHLF